MGMDVHILPIFSVVLPSHVTHRKYSNMLSIYKLVILSNSSPSSSSAVCDVFTWQTIINSLTNAVSAKLPIMFFERISYGLKKHIPVKIVFCTGPSCSVISVAYISVLRNKAYSFSALFSKRTLPLFRFAGMVSSMQLRRYSSRLSKSPQNSLVPEIKSL